MIVVECIVVHKRRFARAVGENLISEAATTKSDVVASRAGALPFCKPISIGNHNNQQQGTKMAVRAFQLLGNTLSLDFGSKRGHPLQGPQ